MNANPPFQRSPLRLEQYYIRELGYAIKESFVDRQNNDLPPTAPDISATVSCSRLSDEGRRWRIELTITSDDAISIQAPYSIRTALVGLFSVDDNYPEERLDALVTINGPSVLYSAAREALLMVTSRSGYPAMMLPTVLFIPPNAPVQQPAGEAKVPSTEATPARQQRKRKSSAKPRKG